MIETIRCDVCSTDYEYEPNRWKGEDGITYEDSESMPDGYLTNGLWICDNCGSCPNCGTSLEKEPKKRAIVANGKLIPSELCEECEIDAENIEYQHTVLGDYSDIQ